MLIFGIEPLSQCWNQVMELAADHHAGTTSYQRHWPFLPSLERYQACEAAGFFTLMTARDHGKLVGYFGVYVTASMHSQHLMMMEDTFYLKPSHRGGRNALRFLQFIEDYAQERGVEEIMFSCEIDNSSGIQKLLEYLGYSPVIIQRSKRLSYATDKIDQEIHAATG